MGSPPLLSRLEAAPARGEGEVSPYLSSWTLFMPFGRSKEPPMPTTNAVTPAMVKAGALDCRASATMPPTRGPATWPKPKMTVTTPSAVEANRGPKPSPQRGCNNRRNTPGGTCEQNPGEDRADHSPPKAGKNESRALAREDRNQCPAASPVVRNRPPEKPADNGN